MDRKDMCVQLKQLLNGAPFAWAVCGGYALELFLNRDIRTHGDVDLCVFEEDRRRILPFMLQKGWKVYEFCGWGKVRPLEKDSESTQGRNLMCVHGTPEIVRFYPSDEPDRLYHEFFHTGLQSLEYLDVLFNTKCEASFVLDAKKGIQRAMQKAILQREGIPYLAPEIVLLYKASRADNADYRLDFEQTYAHLRAEQKAWFSENLLRMYSKGHAWMR